MNTIFIRNGLIVFGLSILIFTLVRIFFYPHFLIYSGYVNSYIFPILYAGLGVLSANQYIKTTKNRSFRSIFKASFNPMLLAGTLTVLSLYIYFNFIETALIETLRTSFIKNINIQLHQLKTDETTRKQQLEMIIYNLKLDSFMNWRYFFLPLLCPIILPFYGIISLICALFYRKP